MSSIYFSINDPLGLNSNVTTLYRYVLNSQNSQTTKPQFPWDAAKNAKVFPRGKAYGKLLTIQFNKKLFK